MATWTSPKTWVAGSPVTAAELNTHLRDNLTFLYDRDVGLTPTLSADVTRNSAAFANLTGLSFSCEAGKNYGIVGSIMWTHSSTSGGPIFSWTDPGGVTSVLFDYTGETSSTSSTRDWVASDDGGTGVATVDSADTRRFCRLFGTYECDTSGTWTIRYARNTTGTLTVRKGSSLFVTSD